MQHINMTSEIINNAKIHKSAQQESVASCCSLLKIWSWKCTFVAIIKQYTNVRYNYCFQHMTLPHRFIICKYICSFFPKDLFTTSLQFHMLAGVHWHAQSEGALICHGGVRTTCCANWRHLWKCETWSWERGCGALSNPFNAISSSVLFPAVLLNALIHL